MPDKRLRAHKTPPRRSGNRKSWPIAGTRVEPDVLAALDRLAASEGTTRAQQVEMAILTHLQRSAA